MVQEQAFVAREDELNRLDNFLEEVLAGRCSVCSCRGSRVAGKTALLTEFAQCAQQRDDDLVFLGDCNAQTGGGDPYLPFREVLGQLTGDVEDKLAQGGITAENADRLPGIMSVSVREASGLRQMKPAQTPYASR